MSSVTAKQSELYAGFLRGHPADGLAISGGVNSNRTQAMSKQACRCVAYAVKVVCVNNGWYYLWK